VVIFAEYFPGNLEIASALGDRLAGKVVVDISNPLNETFDGLATALGTSKERVAQLVRDGGCGLESLGFFGMMLQQPLGLNFRSAWKLIS